MSKLIIHLFGAPGMTVDGAPVEVDTRKATALMAYLAVSGGTHQRDTLAGLLWPDYDQTSARGALRRTLSTLNHALEPARAGHAETVKEGSDSFLVISREKIGVAPDADIWLDVNVFLQLIRSLNGHPHEASEICPACIEALEQAAQLYSEPFMAGFSLRDSSNFEEWQFFQEETLRRTLAGALEKLVFGLEASGRLEEAIQYARRWLALDPLTEEAHRQLMLLYARSGQQSAALRQYRTCARILDEELGVIPLEETMRLYEVILNREPLPAASGRLRYRPVTPASIDALDRAAPTRPEDRADPAQVRAAGEPAPAAKPMVGRDGELAQLTRAWEKISADGLFAALEGEAGIGKTRLAEAFLEQARSRGARVIQARCYSGETGLAYAPLMEGLSAALAAPGAAERAAALPPDIQAEAARLLTARLFPAAQPRSVTQPEDGLSRQVVVEENMQVRFFEALRQVIQTLLDGPVPGVLFFDDLHWADTATLDLLAYLTRRLRGMNLFMLCAWRDESSAAVHALDRLAGEGERSERAVRLKLHRLKPAAMLDLARSSGVGGKTNAAGGLEPELLARRLFQESEGLPFVAVEYLAALAAQPDAITWEMPSSVRNLLHSRLSGLDAATLQLLSAAAVIGRSFAFDILRESSGRSEIETVDGLEHLLSEGLVVEAAAAPDSATPGGNPDAGALPGGESTAIRYDFTHDKLRTLVYEETSLPRRRLLHRRTAEALARTRGAPAGLIAFHFAQAGADAQAAEYHRAAGEHAQRLFANVEALAHFQAALAAGHPDAAGLLESIGDLHTLRGEYATALENYHSAAKLCAAGCRASLEQKLGSVYQRLGEWEQAEEHYLASLEASGWPPEGTPPSENPIIAAPTAFHVRLFADRSLAAHAQGDLNKAQALADQSLALAQRSGDAHALAQAYNALGVLARARGETQTAAAALEASLQAAEALNDPLARIAALNNLALVYGESGSTDQAILLARQALELCQRRGDRHRQAALHNNLADLLHRSGRDDESMEQLKQAVVIFAEIGAPAPAAEGAGIWKLTEW